MTCIVKCIANNTKHKLFIFIIKLNLWHGHGRVLGYNQWSKSRDVFIKTPSVLMPRPHDLKVFKEPETYFSEF